MLPRPSSASSIKELVEAPWFYHGCRLLGSTMLHSNKELQNLWSSFMQSRLEKVESQSQSGCLRNAFHVFALQWTRLLHVAALHKFGPAQIPPGMSLCPFAAWILGSCWCQSQINLRLLTSLCSRVTPAIRLQRLSNWGTRLNDLPAWIRPVTKDKTKSAVVEI